MTNRKRNSNSNNDSNNNHTPKVVFQFKVQQYQTEAVESVLQCFDGQTKSSPNTYTIDPGRIHNRYEILEDAMEKDDDEPEIGYANAPINIDIDIDILENIKKVQIKNLIPPSKTLDDFHTLGGRKGPKPLTQKAKKTISNIAKINIDIEMETGTGKTYCYTKTMFEMYNRYGWNKFIIIVPNIAIREGVHKSLEMTKEHFRKLYGHEANYFIYDSNQLEDIIEYSNSSELSIMIINIQAFNSTKSEKLKIDQPLDTFNSRKPIDVIKANKPILIIDEPQKNEGEATVESLKSFKPLFVLRYSATHKTQHNLVHRLDAIDAFNQKLVKKIAVTGLSVDHRTGSGEYIYLSEVKTSEDKNPYAICEIEIDTKHGINRVEKKLNEGDKLFDISNKLEQYRNTIITAVVGGTERVRGYIELQDGTILHEGDSQNGNTEVLRKLQIREAIKAHLDKEQELFPLGIKALALFFIDKVANYRIYDENGNSQKGDYAKWFETEYATLVDELLKSENTTDSYKQYLRQYQANEIHDGYFAIDKGKGNKGNDGIWIDTKDSKTGRNNAKSQQAYDLIMKDKEQLLDLGEPIRFIFSHSALREGWDNPNIFTICLLKEVDNASNIARRQEVGRGLRICVNKYGVRQDENPNTVHNINKLNVIINEDYESFVEGLQSEIAQTISRPQTADKNYFTNKTVILDGYEPLTLNKEQANDIHRYLIKNDYIDRNDFITEKYHNDKENNTLEPLPEDLKLCEKGIFTAIDSVHDKSIFNKMITNAQKQKTININKNNMAKKEFQELWNRINKKGIYQVEFNSSELITNSVEQINKQLNIPKPEYLKQRGEQVDNQTKQKVDEKTSIKKKSTQVVKADLSIGKTMYDLVGKIADNTDLTRKTVVNILTGIHEAKFNMFHNNPEDFIKKVSFLIMEQLGTVIVKGIKYNITHETYDLNEIFTVSKGTVSGEKLKKHLYDYAITDSKVERKFANELDGDAEVSVFTKLPRGFTIPTPVGDYNPDWAIAFNDSKIQSVYFVAETKGSTDSTSLRGIETAKIKCAEKFFEALSKADSSANVKYGVVKDYAGLRNLIEWKS